jgi:transcriptional regulator with XRE-family HTH domain
LAPATSVLLPSLVYWRAQRRLTQEQLAERLGMSRNTVWRIEAGYPAFMRTTRLLAKALSVQVADLQRQPPES